MTLEERNQKRIRFCIAYVHKTVAKLTHTEATSEVLLPFMHATSWVYLFKEKLDLFMIRVVKVQRSLKANILQDKFREKYLEKYWKKQVEDFREELAGSRKRDDIAFFKTFVQYDVDLARDLQKLYLDRCRFK